MWWKQFCWSKSHLNRYVVVSQVTILVFILWFRFNYFSEVKYNIEDLFQIVFEYQKPIFAYGFVFILTIFVWIIQFLCLQMVTQLRHAHAQGQNHAGINVRKGTITNMLDVRFLSKNKLFWCKSNLNGFVGISGVEITIQNAFLEFLRFWIVYVCRNRWCSLCLYRSAPSRWPRKPYFLD